MAAVKGPGVPNRPQPSFQSTTEFAIFLFDIHTKPARTSWGFVSWISYTESYQLRLGGVVCWFFVWSNTSLVDTCLLNIDVSYIGLTLHTKTLGHWVTSTCDSRFAPHATRPSLRFQTRTNQLEESSPAIPGCRQEDFYIIQQLKQNSWKRNHIYKLQTIYLPYFGVLCQFSGV